MNIRPGRNADVPALAQLFTASVHKLTTTYYDAAQRPAWAPQPPDLDYWRRRLMALHTLVAEDDTQIAGFLSYESNGYVDLLYTSPAYARHGVAGLLYSYAELALATHGVDEIFTEASLAARPFFERQGFRVVEEQKVFVRAISFRRFAMRKSVPAT